MPIVIRKSSEVENDTAVAFTALVDGKYAGALIVSRGIQKPFYRVSQINVHPSLRGQGVGKALYNAAASHACSKKRVLVSDFDRSEWAEAFWRTQAKRGRARCMIRNKRVLPYEDYRENVFGGPREEAYTSALLKCQEWGHRNPEKCAERIVKLEMRGLPRPTMFTTFRNYRARRWPCARWASKKSACKLPTPFQGLSFGK